jgi:hypothetical protein
VRTEATSNNVTPFGMPKTVAAVPHFTAPMALSSIGI